MATTEVVEATEDREALQKQAHELDQAIRSGLTAGRKTLWDVARELHEFDEISGWVHLGCETRAEWLADPEISMTSSTFFRLVRAFRELAIARKVDPDRLAVLDISKVDIVLPKVQSGKVRLKEALNDVEALGARDLREKYIVPRELTPAFDVDEEEDYVEGEPPTQEQWDEVLAGRGRRNLVKFIIEKTEWALIEGEDGSEREHWVVSEAPGGGPDGSGDLEEGSPLAEDAEGLRSPENGVGREPSKTVMRRAAKDWDRLCDELIGAAESGQENPRIDVRLIRPGIQGANLLMRWRTNERGNG
jgi:hypothetical protein